MVILRHPARASHGRATSRSSPARDEHARVGEGFDHRFGWRLRRGEALQQQKPDAVRSCSIAEHEVAGCRDHLHG